MDGCDVFPNAKAGRGERVDELECARLQLETGHENHRYPSFDEGVIGLKRLILDDPQGCKNSVGVFQVATDATRGVDCAIAQTTNVDDRKR